MVNFLDTTGEEPPSYYRQGYPHWEFDNKVVLSECPLVCVFKDGERILAGCYSWQEAKQEYEEYNNNESIEQKMQTKLLKDGRTAVFHDGKWIAPITKERAKLLKALRDAGKIMNFSALYGSGAKGLANFLQKEFPDKSFEELLEMAKLAIASKKGKKNRKTGLFEGGTDSGAFNMMAEISLKSKVPTLPALGTKISTALRPAVVGNDFVPGRMNWAIQSSGAEVLSITLVVMHWLCQEYNIPIYFVISIHDELWWMTPERHAEDAAALFQISHLYTWGLFNERLGITDLACNNAFFSGVAIDDRVRKSPDESTVSPSNPQGHLEPDGKEYSAKEMQELNFFKVLQK